MLTPTGHSSQLNKTTDNTDRTDRKSSSMLMFADSIPMTNFLVIRKLQINMFIIKNLLIDKNEDDPSYKSNNNFSVIHYQLIWNE